MHHRFLALCGAIVVVSVGVSLLVTPVTAQTRTAAVTSPTAEAKNWKPARTPWGHPDLSGVYSNSDENGIAFERPDEFVGRRLEDITRPELEKLNRDRQAATLGRATDNEARPVDRLAFWEVLNSTNSRTWLVVAASSPDRRADMPRSAGRSAARRADVVSISACACARLSEGASRPMANHCGESLPHPAAMLATGINRPTGSLKYDASVRGN